MKTQIAPRTGHLFVCIKSNKRHSAVKGKIYLYDSGELKTFTTRSVLLLANGDEMLELPGVFERAEVCPFCNTRVYVAGDDVEIGEHDVCECAAMWDARVKNYCRYCNADTDGRYRWSGKCEKCQTLEA